MYIQESKGVIILNKESNKGVRYVATATVRKWGNSLALRIPQEISELLKYKDGVNVEMYVNDKEQELVLRTVFPDANDQVALREHFLSLRAKCKPEMETHKEIFEEPKGDEII